ncbi:MAG: fimbrillin family protein, partial [Bacteroidaceae bacterium]|nr:fimbrillin family protein [Bacteroidaceae bacterium]
MKNKLRFLSLFAIAATIGFTACSDEDDFIEAGPQSSYKINISGEITQVYQTRVNDAGFCNGDEVGIFVVDYDGSTPGQLLDEGNRADNVKHTFDEANYKWTSAYELFFKDKKTNVDIYGYYPFANPDNVSAYAFEVQKDQSTTAAYGKIGGYEASDFLWGKAQNIAPTDKVIKLGFRHMMASARVTLAEGTGFAEGEWGTLEKAVLMLNTKREATINLSTGEVTAVGNVPSTGTIPYANGGDYRAIIVPQTVAAGTPLVSITVGGTPYLLKKGEAFTYAASKQHNFTITVNKREGAGYEFVLTSESITAWENDAVSHDAMAREYIVIDVQKAGTLDACIAAAGKDLGKVRNLKITGQITSKDFATMKYLMPRLSALNLKEVVIVAGEGGSIEGVHDGGYGGCRDNEIPAVAMNKKESLVSLVLPDKLTYISGASGGNGGAFAECTNLSGSLVIPEGVVEIGYAAFAECTSLTGTLSLPSTLKKIGEKKGYVSGWDGAFKNCNFVCELILPEGLEVIGLGSFANCKNLYGELRLPDGLKEIGEGAFEGCENLTGDLIIPQGITDIPNNCFNR